MKDHAILDIRVIPRAKRNEVGGWRNGMLVVRVTAPPLEGRANEAVLTLLAEALGVNASAVSLVGGRRGRNKRVAIRGLQLHAVKTRLGPR